MTPRVNILAYSNSQEIGGTETQLRTLVAETLDHINFHLFIDKGAVHDWINSWHPSAETPPNGVAQWAHQIRSKKIDYVLLLRGELGPIIQAAKVNHTPLLLLCGYPAKMDDSFKALLCLVDKVFCPSNFVSRHIPHSKVLQCGIDSEIFTPPTNEQRRIHRKKLNIPEEAIVVGYVGRNPPYKNLAQWVSLAQEYIKKDPTLYFLLITPEAPNFATHPQLICRPSKPETVVDYLSAMDIFASLATNEGLGCSTLEAMSCEIPIIANETSGASDLLKNGSGGLLFRTQEEFSSQLSLLIAEKEQRERIGREGRQIIQAHYSKKALGPHFMRLLECR